MAGVAGDPSSVRQWKGAHPGVGVRYEEDRKALGKGGGGGGHCCRKLYNQHKSVVPYCFSLFPSFPFSLPSPSHFLPPLPLFHGCASPCPRFAIPPLLTPAIAPWILLALPAPWALLRHRWSPSLPHSPSCFISTVVCLHAFFIDRPLFCCLPGIYPLSTRLY